MSLYLNAVIRRFINGAPSINQSGASALFGAVTAVFRVRELV